MSEAGVGAPSEPLAEPVAVPIAEPMHSAKGRRFDAVIFDVGGVLTTSVSALMAKQLEPHGVTLAEFLPIAMGPLDADTDHPWHRLERGEITVAEFTEAQSILAREAGFASFPSLPDSDALKEGLRASDDMIAFAREVRAAGYATAIITNNIKEWDGWQGIVHAHELVDVVVDSSAVGMRKPAPGIFEYTLKALGDIAPERALFLDDFPWNIAGAQRVGLATIHVTDHTTAITEARSLLF
jgi:putative hydrolase of the HAD superfamily